MSETVLGHGITAAQLRLMRGDLKVKLGPVYTLEETSRITGISTRQLNRHGYKPGMSFAEVAKLVPEMYDGRRLDLGNHIVVDPRVNAGKPSVGASGVDVGLIVGRVRDGESIRQIAKDYPIAPSVIEDVLRWVLKR